VDAVAEPTRASAPPPDAAARLPRASVGATDWTPARSAAGTHNPWLVAVVVALPVFMEVLDTSIAQVALRHIAGSLAASNDESTWVITSYLVANAAILPICGWLSDILGRKQFFVICVVTFTIASFLCGMATSLPQLIAFRVLQGLGGGGMIPSSQAMLADTFPPAKRGLAFAIWGMAVVVSPVLGPPLGGWITDMYSWPWIFFINIPVGIASVFLCLALLDEPALLVQERERRWRAGLHLDFVGFALAAIGLACLEVMLSKGEQKDWFASPLVRNFALVSGSALLLTVVWEFFRRDAVVEVRLFGGRTFATSFVVMFAAGAVLYASTTILPMLLQGVHGYTAFDSGLALLPGGVSSAVGMIAVGVLTRFVQLRHIVALGMLLQVIGMGWMTTFTPDLTFWHAATIRAVQAFGFGAMTIPLITLSYEGLAPERTNGATILMNVARNIGGSVGISMTNTWLAWRMQYHHSVLAEHVNPYNGVVTEALAGLQTTLPTEGDTLTDPGIVTLLDGLVNRQAVVIAYNDIFLLLALMCLGVLLLVALLPRNDPGHGEVAMH